jgi:hypothetical protein
MKTNALTGAALDWAVAKCEGTLHDDGSVSDYFQPSTDWEQGGAIIECERIELRDAGGDGWAADDNLRATQYGATPLIAAMRCYVASKLGDEIEVPEELQGETV